MCGIVGYVGDRECKELLLTGLERLEYRGYDSAGIALVNGSIDVTRRVGRVQMLRDAVGNGSHPATLGLAHTRWATHGGVTESNAHPIEACEGSGVTAVPGAGPRVPHRHRQRGDQPPGRGALRR